MTQASPPKSFSVTKQERRSNQRYELHLDLQYRLCGAREISFGTIRDLSSGGACLTTTQVLSPGTKVELSIDWPMLLDGVCPLKLVLTGKVVRSDERAAAVKTLRYEFRTRRLERALYEENSDRIQVA